MEKEIKINSVCSTISAMEHIKNNGGIKEGDHYFFRFDYHELLIVSLAPKIFCDEFIEEFPLDTWHDIKGMKRIQVDCEPWWLAYINGKIYSITWTM